jgi:hypothetical protein
MKSSHRKTLGTLFTDPDNGALAWSRIEALSIAAGCEVTEGSRSSVTFIKGQSLVHFPLPAPAKRRLALSRSGRAAFSAADRRTFG